MNKTSLSSLYRRLTADPSAAPIAEVRLALMLSELRPDSEALAAAVADATRRNGHRSRHAGIARRPAAGRRIGLASRWAAAAACLVAIVGVWTLRHSLPQPGTSQTPHVRTVARADEIFNSNDSIFGGSMDRQRHAQRPASDKLFHGNFNG